MLGVGKSRGSGVCCVLFLWYVHLEHVKESWCRKVRGKGRRGISFAWRQHRFFFVDFLLLTLSHEKLEETGKEEEEKEEE